MRVPTSQNLILPNLSSTMLESIGQTRQSPFIGWGESDKSADAIFKTFWKSALAEFKQTRLHDSETVRSFFIEDITLKSKLGHFV